MQVSRVLLQREKGQYKDRNTVNGNQASVRVYNPHLNRKQFNMKCNPSFTGDYYGGKYYTDQEISDAKRWMNSADSPEWRRSCVLEISDRYGFWEYSFTQAPERYVDKVAKLIPELKSKELAKKAAKAAKINARALAKATHTKAVDSLHILLMDAFVNKLNSNSTASPQNCILLEDASDDYSKELIKWTKENSPAARIVKLENANNEQLQRTLWDKLLEAREEFLKPSKKRTLIHVEGFDRLINPKINSFENIDSIKDIMGRCAKDFGTTIIFRTKNAAELTKEAIQPHRVGKIIKVAIKSIK